MIRKIEWVLKLPFILILILALLPLAPNTALAKKKKKKYKRETVRTQALDLIRNNSETVSELAGLEPLSEETYATINGEPVIGEAGEDIQELENEDDVTVDLEMFKTMWLSYVSGDDEKELTTSGLRKSDVMDNILNWLGVNYRFGGMGANGIDCSAFVREIYNSTCKVLLPRTARDQFTVGEQVSRRSMEFGDLVFFHTRKRVYVSHVGIYLGDNLFAHASSKYGVTVSSLESTYYKNRFIGAKRISVEDLRRFSKNHAVEASAAY